MDIMIVYYAKLGMRMAKITEAWLYKQNYKNIFTTDWRDKQLEYLKERCSKRYKHIIVVSKWLFRRTRYITKRN